MESLNNFTASYAATLAGAFKTNHSSVLLGDAIENIRTAATAGFYETSYKFPTIAHPYTRSAVILELEKLGYSISTSNSSISTIYISWVNADELPVDAGKPGEGFILTKEEF